MNILTKILVVEDQFVEANLLRLMLKKAGYTVCGIARSVDDARKKMAEQRPELVLLDIFLSGRETGIDLAGYLREEDIPFIYLSASSNEDILRSAKATHPYGFLVKPFRDRDLLITLEIAQQHIEHGMQSGMRKEALFHQQLKELSGSPDDWPQRLLAICRAIQPLIPLDHMEVIYRTEGQPMNDMVSFLRMGYNEYRCLSADDPGEMSKRKEIRDLLGNIPLETRVRLHTGAAFEKSCETTPLMSLTARQLGMRSCLTLPVPLTITGKGSFYFSFYSRQAYGFTESHAALCQRLQQQLIYTMEDILARKSLPDAGIVLPSARTGFEAVIGESTALLTVFDHVTQVASCDTSVLITGESGTGKESIACSIHELSTRKKKPFIKVSCAAFPVHLIESELFGHEKGAFTGAADRRIGKFEQADGGTFFLDEIGELPLDVQAKLLRVLQEREIERIGGRAPVKVNVRIIAATNRNLEKEVAEGKFRLDLYYRLNVFPIHVPALRERAEDISLLVQHFVTYYSRKTGRKVRGVTAAVLKELQTYHWPGNIRQLENIIERSVLLEKGEIIGHISLPPADRCPDPSERGVLKTKTIEENEREHILAVLKKCDGRIRGTGGAAEILGVPPTTLASKIKKLGIRRQFTE
jgi:DNA-binding NtrC family response regulator